MGSAGAEVSKDFYCRASWSGQRILKNDNEQPLLCWNNTSMVEIDYQRMLARQG